MPDLVVHIGLPKTGSTTLQKQVFSKERGYLGQASWLTPDDLGTRLKACGPFEGRQFTSVRCLREWSKRAHEEHRMCWPDEDRLIVSDEILGSASRLQARPVIGLFRHLKQGAWSGGRVRAILVLRNQADRLASGYAQSSKTNFAAGQADFEAYVRSNLKDERPRLDYGQWVLSLGAVLGKENVCVLLLEESSTPRFWQELRDFAGLTTLVPMAQVHAKNRENVRRVGSNTWQLRAADAMRKAEVESDKWLNLLWPSGRFTRSRNTARSALTQKLLATYEKRISRGATPQRPDHIELTPSLRAEVKRALAQSNDKLSDWLGRDITPLGY